MRIFGLVFTTKKNVNKIYARGVGVGAERALRSIRDVIVNNDKIVVGKGILAMEGCKVKGSIALVSREAVVTDCQIESKGDGIHYQAIGYDDEYY